jgi:hypothetical protein
VIADWIVAIIGLFFLTQSENTVGIDQPDQGSDDRDSDIVNGGGINVDLIHRLGEAETQHQIQLLRHSVGSEKLVNYFSGGCVPANVQSELVEH